MMKTIYHFPYISIFIKSAIFWAIKSRFVFTCFMKWVQKSNGLSNLDQCKQYFDFSIDCRKYLLWIMVYYYTIFAVAAALFIIIFTSPSKERLFPRFCTRICRCSSVLSSLNGNIFGKSSNFKYIISLPKFNYGVFFYNRYTLYWSIKYLSTFWFNLSFFMKMIRMNISICKKRIYNLFRGMRAVEGGGVLYARNTKIIP